MMKGELQDYLYRNVKRRNWERVIAKCEEEIEALYLWLTEAMDTILHLAVYDNNFDVVDRLVRLICRSQKEEILKLKNERKNTPLHVAAAIGCVRMCQVIGSVNKELVDERNKDGETPLFLAALHGHKKPFYCLYDFCSMDPDRAAANCRRNNGDTILHHVLRTEQFDVAFQLISMINEAATWVDKEGYTPLHVLATKPSAFKSGTYMRLWQRILYHFIQVYELKAESTASLYKPKIVTEQLSTASHFPKNYATCIAFMTNLWDLFLIITNLKHTWKKKEMNSCNYNDAMGPDLEKGVIETHESDPPLDTQPLKRPRGHQSVIATSSNDVDDKTEIIEIHQSDPPFNTQPLKRTRGYQSDKKPPSSNFPQNYNTCIDFFQIILSALWIILGCESGQIRKLLEMKQKHKWSVQVMEKLLEFVPLDKYEETQSEETQSDETTPYLFIEADAVAFNKMDIAAQPNYDEGDKVNAFRKDSAMLLAAKNGVVEMVSKIYEKFPLAIRDSNRDQKNVVLLAAEYRQPDVYKFLLKKKNHLEPLFRAVDRNGDSALHLAARLKTRNSWRIKGAALQMQLEYVRDSVETHFFPRYNNKGILARDIFCATHNELGKEGLEWLTNTSESCSVLAALVVTVAYASAATVPGGNGDHGTPPFIKETGFLIFSLASLIALCSSTISLIMFLAILSSRFDEVDFGLKLPNRLFVGLFSLFFSIVAMLVSFCAGHYFLLSRHLQSIAFFIYIATSLPVALFFVKVQLPLICDLLFVILSKIPKRSNDVILIDDSTLN
ncbi:uncharacterized protein LOC120077630 isoform X2 [Benincasa hispida]|uniref:uncharacterized protein LOC120077630 isoform X2 n=1 Tax=Benincasa hispida TaxID=102211 RepID=UPI001900C05C|nr:uncharacterized protein LOC120077630 isoform X2 [Benincasa hispida]